MTIQIVRSHSFLELMVVGVTVPRADRMGGRGAETSHCHRRVRWQQGWRGRGRAGGRGGARGRSRRGPVGAGQAAKPQPAGAHMILAAHLELPVVLRVEGGQLEAVEVLQQVLNLVRPVDVRHGVDPVAGGGRAGGRDVRGHGEAAEAALAHAGPTQRAAVQAGEGGPLRLLQPTDGGAAVQPAYGGPVHSVGRRAGHC